MMGERDFDLLHQSLLKSASKGWQALFFDVSFRSAQFKSDYTHYTIERSELSKQNALRDRIAETLYPKDGPIHISPVRVYGDGNCFYRAMSKALFGHEERHIELRVMTVLELVKFSKKYVSQATYDGMCSHPPSVQYVLESSVSDDALVPQNFLKSVQNETLKSIKSGEYCSLIHIFAAANALNHPIYSVYPSFQNAAMDRNILHQEIKPLPDTSGHKIPGSPIYIMWSHTENSGKDNWTPNHFVVCFPLSATESDDSNEPAKKKARENIDTPMDCHTQSENVEAKVDSNEQNFTETKASEAEEIKNAEHFEDPIDKFDLGKIVNGTIKLSMMSSAEKINYIQNQPLPDAIGKLQTGRTKAKNKTEKKQKLFHFSLHIFIWNDVG